MCARTMLILGSMVSPRSASSISVSIAARHAVRRARASALGVA
jgi:hypothetical protein